MCKIVLMDILLAHYKVIIETQNTCCTMVTLFLPTWLLYIQIASSQ